MRETQQMEFKEFWRDDYLKWICGFANADGGVLQIGRNDQGEAVGIPDAEKLLEELPNKIRDLLGIMVSVDLLVEQGKDLLEIRIDPYPSPINYKGRYFLRSGSTNQALKGTALDRFLMRKQGQTWDGVPIPHISVGDLSDTAIALFRTLARQGRRLGAAQLDSSPSELLDKLDLVDGDYLKRATVLLFHATPERFFTGAFVKIGYFQTESELLYHDEINGDLFTQTQKAMDLLTTKYLKAMIGYEGIHRTETLPVPEAALREAVLNALIHRDYSIPAPIQIRVYADRLKIWNPAHLPESWTIEKLREAHSSRPYNPSIANAFFRAGEIEAWGRGIQRIIEACRKGGAPDPVLDYTPGDLWVEFPFAPDYLKTSTETTQKPGAETPVETTEETPVETPGKIMRLLGTHPEMTLREVALRIGKSIRAVERASVKLVKAGKLKRVGPKKGGHWEVLK